jgi:hypothetical protein
MFVEKKRRRTRKQKRGSTFSNNTNIVPRRECKIGVEIERERNRR